MMKQFKLFTLFLEHNNEEKYYLLTCIGWEDITLTKKVFDQFGNGPRPKHV